MPPAEVNVSNSRAGAPGTVNQSCLPWSAQQVIQEDRAKALTKERIVEDRSTWKDVGDNCGGDLVIILWCAYGFKLHAMVMFIWCISKQ